MNKKKDDYWILFQGAKISKREANKVGLGIVFGLIGICLTQILPYLPKMANYMLIFIFVVLGYFGIGNRIFK